MLKGDRRRRRSLPAIGSGSLAELWQLGQRLPIMDGRLDLDAGRPHRVRHDLFEAYAEQRPEEPRNQWSIDDRVKNRSWSSYPNPLLSNLSMRNAGKSRRPLGLPGLAAHGGGRGSLASKPVQEAADRGPEFFRRDRGDRDRTPPTPQSRGVQDRHEQVLEGDDLLRSARAASARRDEQHDRADECDQQSGGHSPVKRAGRFSTNAASAS